MRKIMLFLALLLFVAANAVAQDVRVSGQVLSAEDDEPLAGATVRVPGTTVATATDADGHFTLSGLGPSDKHIEVSFIGYETQSVAVKPQLTIRLSMKTEVMDEVMVVAFGKQKRESFTGSASVVSAADIERHKSPTRLKPSAVM